MAPDRTAFASCFEQVFDVVVFGAGCAGFAAARAAVGRGKSVLLVDLRGDVVWECGRAMMPDAGEAGAGDVGDFLREVARHGGYRDGQLDGAIAEVVANEWVRSGGVRALYYAAPVAVEREGDLLSAVIVATKGGLRRIAGRQWIDATESGRLCRLAQPIWAGSPATQSAFLFLQQIRWEPCEMVDIDVPELRDCRVTWEPTMWPNQRCLRIDMPGAKPSFRRTYVPALRALRALYGDAMKDAFVSHASVEPFPTYDRSATADLEAANLVAAVPGLAGKPIRTLAGRFALGIEAERALADRPACDAAQVRALTPQKTTIVLMKTDVAVIGAGTGGALAAIAAAREGAKVMAFEPLNFPGGVGTGGGIPVYYWGTPGGLQDEVDARVREIMPLFTPPEMWGKRFHPDAKKVVLEEMLSEAGVELVAGALLGSVTVRDGRVMDALIATPRGPVQVRAKSWIDGTGDGDLAALAGAKFRLGRAGDGNLHAYTQSSHYFRDKDNRLIAGNVNFDSGYADPSESEDMTRARVTGIHQYAPLANNEIHRPNCLAPLMGLREGRLFDTDTVVTIDDLFERRRFPDSIGLTGCHYDNHAVDYEFESDMAMFMVWACGLRGARTACEMPYRMLLPKGLENLWLACRAFGVTDEAHASVRMQRDIQRAGEACGIAAALAARGGGRSREIPFDDLRARLEKSGALALPATADPKFGKAALADHWKAPYAGLSGPERIRACLADLSGEAFGMAMWQVYRAGPDAAVGGLKPLLDSGDANISWRAAGVFAAWGDATAEPRLLDAVTRREAGPEYDAMAGDEQAHTVNKPVPRWWIAAALLRMCGTPRCIAPLADLAKTPELQLNARNVIALTLARVAERNSLTAEHRALVEQTLQTLLATPPPHAVAIPYRNPVTGADHRYAKPWVVVIPIVEEDFTWQVHYAVAQARRALGLPIQPEARRFLSDPRVIIRRAFAKIAG